MKYYAAGVIALLVLTILSSDAADQSPNLNPTHVGYLNVSDSESSGRLFYLYYESREDDERGASSEAPIIVWLQGGPGCSSLFGALYELGPEAVTTDLSLEPNLHSWNRRAGLLFIDQPVGTGFSIPGSDGIPTDEMALAADLYSALQAFFTQYGHLRHRPVVIAGESYAGKYVPSIGHFILQQNSQATAAGGSSSQRNPSRGKKQASKFTRTVPEHVLATRPLARHRPVFELKGLVIGNGLTSPALQAATHADVAHSMGLIDRQQRESITVLQQHVIELIAAEQWADAHERRNELLGAIADAAGLATLLDVRRSEEYDAEGAVEQFLNQEGVKVSIGARTVRYILILYLCSLCLIRLIRPKPYRVECQTPDVRMQCLTGWIFFCALCLQKQLGVPNELAFESCSSKVEAALGPDVMHSVSYLIPDLLAAYPLLLYQGAFDLQDGPPSSEAWIDVIDWPGREKFNAAERKIIRQSNIQGRKIALTMQGKTDEVNVGVKELSQGVGDVDSNEGSDDKSVVYWKAHDSLTHVVIRDAGHMVPRDAPEAMLWVLETWLEDSEIMNKRRGRAGGVAKA